MIDVGGSVDAWQIEFTQEDLGSVASAIEQDLRHADVATAPAVYRMPREATLGTPEIIVTIIVTAAAKALVVSGLHALEQALERHIGGVSERRAQIVLTDAATPKQRFPISLRSVGRDGLRRFISQIEAAVQRF